MYEDPNVAERKVQAVFTFASDDTNAPEMRGDIVDGINDLADSLGCDVEISGPDEAP